jgi:hypothetical protein
VKVLFIIIKVRNMKNVSIWYQSKEIFFTCQQKYVTSQINKDTNSYYITPICIYFFGNNKGNFIISPISSFFWLFSKGWQNRIYYWKEKV